MRKARAKRTQIATLARILMVGAPFALSTSQHLKLFAQRPGREILRSSRRAAVGGIMRIGGKAQPALGKRVGKERGMRFMLSFRIPTDEGNAAVRDGRIGETIQSILEDLKPEAAYFADIEGARGGYLVVNMDDASQIPANVEPLFLALGATVKVHPVFTPEDMPRAMEALQQAAQKYG